MMNDLTVGKPEAVLWKFCMPLFGSIVFQQLYNIADSFVAGKFIGENALAAVGNSYEITLIFIAICLRLQHGVFCYCVTVLWSKKIRKYEDCCLYSDDYQCNDMYCYNGLRSAFLRFIAWNDQYTGRIAW